MVSLDNLVKMNESVSPPAIYRYNQSYSATISATPAAGVSLGEAIKEMDAIAKGVLPPGFSTTLAGQSRDYAESSSSLIFAFIFAIILIYLVLAAQFESLIDPFIILLTVPMALTGALLSLWITGHSINVFSEIGIIMLIGLITKNGILIVEFANQRKEEGLSVRDAVLGCSLVAFSSDINDNTGDDLRNTSHCIVVGNFLGKPHIVGYCSSRRVDLCRTSYPVCDSIGLFIFLPCLCS